MASSSESSSPSIVLVGASVRAAAEAARRAGFVPWCADLFADADLAATCSVRTIEHYPDDLPRLLRAAPAAPWMYTGAVENHPGIVAEISASRELWGVGPWGIERVRDPWKVAAALARHGIATPALAATPDGLPLDGSWLVKRFRSAGGQFVQPWRRDATPPRAGHYFQQFIDGASCSAVFVAAAGRGRFLGATRQLIGAPWTGATGFRYAGSIGPLAMRGAALDRVVALGDALAAEFPLRGLFGVDFILRDEEVWPIEVNPRFTASIEILERADDLRAIHWHAEACRHGRLTGAPAAAGGADMRHGKAILFASEAINVRPETTTALLAMNDGLPWPRIADIPRAGSLLEAGWPVATVFASGPNDQEVLDGLREGIALLVRLLGVAPPGAANPSPRTWL